MKNLFQVPQYAIIGVGSVDGICTTAAVARLLTQAGYANPTVIFTQAFAVDKLDIAILQPSSHVILVDLAVNNRDEQMTINFVQRLEEAGHNLIAVCDEHDGEAWGRVLEATGIDPYDLAIKPVSGKNAGLNSSGALLLSMLDDECDSHVVELCEAADAGDRMDFTPRFSEMVNQAVKSKIGDDSRRIYLARFLAAGSSEPDETIADWISEYDAILATHEEIKVDATDLGRGIVRIDASGKNIDMTTLLGDLYRSGAKVVVMLGDAFVPGRGKVPQVSFATGDRSLDLLAVVKAVIPSASGFASKANMDPEFEHEALEAIKNFLTS